MPYLDDRGQNTATSDDVAAVLLGEGVSHAHRNTHCLQGVAGCAHAYWHLYLEQHGVLPRCSAVACWNLYKAAVGNCTIDAMHEKLSRRVLLCALASVTVTASWHLVVDARSGLSARQCFLICVCFLGRGHKMDVTVFPTP